MPVPCSDDPVRSFDWLSSNGAEGLRPALVRYPQGRHEILNETNRTEVVQNLLNWLNQVIDHDGKDPLRASNRVEN